MIASRAAEKPTLIRERLGRYRASLRKRSWFSGRAGCLEQSAHHQALDLAALSAPAVPLSHPSVAIFSLRAMRSFKRRQRASLLEYRRKQGWFLIVPVGQSIAYPARNRLQPGGPIVHEIASQRLLPVHAPCQGFLKARSGEACLGTKPPTCAKSSLPRPLTDYLVVKTQKLVAIFRRSEAAAKLVADSSPHCVGLSLTQRALSASREGEAFGTKRANVLDPAVQFCARHIQYPHRCSNPSTYC